MLASVSALLAGRNLSIIRSKEGALTTSEWIASGSLTPSTSPNGAITIVPHKPPEVAEALARDALRLSLAGRETLEAISTARNVDNIHPAWSSIQIYYAAFYYTSAILRLLGISQSYLHAVEMQKLRLLLSAINVSPLPGSGLYKISFNQAMTSAEFTKLNDGSHEALWMELRSYINSLKAQIPSIYSMTAEEHEAAISELDAVFNATKGLSAQANLSSTRNEVQYRQKLSCWYPNTRRVKYFHDTNRIEQALSENFNPRTVLQGGDSYDGFFTRSLAICGFMHQVLTEIGKTSDSGTLGAKYKRFDRALAR